MRCVWGRPCTFRGCGRYGWENHQFIKKEVSAGYACMDGIAEVVDWPGVPRHSVLFGGWETTVEQKGSIRSFFLTPLL
jgi:hypothetical protein